MSRLAARNWVGAVFQRAENGGRLRLRRAWAGAGVAVLFAGLLPVVLLLGGDSAPRMLHLPRPLAGGESSKSAPVEFPAQTPSADPTVDVTQQPNVARDSGKTEYSPTSVVVSLRDPANSDPVTSRGAEVVGEISGTGFIRVRTTGDPVELVAALRSDPAVVEASLDFGRRAAAGPNDPLYNSNQANYLNLMRMSEAWNAVSNATSNVVAVIDSGIDASHPDLAGRVVVGYNVVAPGTPPTDESGHGTFVAGVIAANTNNGTGVAGVTWNGRVMPVKVFGGPTAFDSDIATGIVWAVRNGARVINLSLGGPGYSPLLLEAVLYATERDVVVVASSGNEGTDEPQYPAAFPSVVAVGATDSNGQLVDFSSYGDWVDLAAPGFDIVSTFPGGGYATGDGTSFAAPMVAGIAAMVRTQNPALTQGQVVDRLRSAARDAGPRGFDQYYGYGLVDAARSLTLAFAADLPFPAIGAGEPNDIPARATPVLIGLTMTGSLGVEGDVDWYRVDAGPLQPANVAVFSAGFNPDSGQNADLVLEVYTGQSRVVVDAHGAGFSEGWTGQLGPDPAYIRVSNFNGAADPRQYTLTVAPTAPEASTPDIEVHRYNAGPREVRVGDVTGDRRDDIVTLTGQVVAGPNENKLFVLAQDQSGVLSEPIWYTPMQSVVFSMTILDVDQDGLLDVAVSGNTGVEWWRQAANGTLESQGMLGGITGQSLFIDSFDVNGDGASDLVASTSTDLTLLTHGAGSTFTASVIPGALRGLGHFALGDVDSDGRGDVVAPGLQVLRNKVSGWTSTFLQGVGPAPGGSAGFATVRDVTGDGRADIVASILANGSITVINVFVQNEDGSLAAPVPYDAGRAPQGSAADDLNGDGRVDVAVMNTNYRALTLLYQQPDATLGNRQTIRVPNSEAHNNKGLAFGDINDDGHRELVVLGDTTLSIIRHVPVETSKNFVRSVSPDPYAPGVSPATAPTVLFGTDMDSSTVDDFSVRLMDGRTGASVPASVSYDAASRTATITPVSSLHRAKPYRIVVNGALTSTGQPIRPFTSTFVTNASGPQAALQDFAVYGVLGRAADVNGVVPIGDAGDLIVRYASGPTPPASVGEGSGGYSGPAGGIMLGGLTPGQTYSFSVWYRDRNATLSPRSTATLVGMALTMTGTTTGAGITSADVTFGGTFTTSTGPGVGVSVPLVAHCADGPYAGTTVATATGGGAGGLSATLRLSSTRCAFRWEINYSTQYMGGASDAVRVSVGPNQPPGDRPPRER